MAHESRTRGAKLRAYVRALVEEFGYDKVQVQLAKSRPITQPLVARKPRGPCGVDELCVLPGRHAGRCKRLVTCGTFVAGE